MTVGESLEVDLTSGLNTPPIAAALPDVSYYPKYNL